MDNCVVRTAVGDAMAQVRLPRRCLSQLASMHHSLISAAGVRMGRPSLWVGAARRAFKSRFHLLHCVPIAISALLLLQGFQAHTDAGAPCQVWSAPRYCAAAGLAVLAAASICSR